MRSKGISTATNIMKDGPKKKCWHTISDLLQVKVHLKEHFYVFSRFLMSRILTLIKVNDKDAIKITLDIKKFFVETNKTEVTQ